LFEELSISVVNLTGELGDRDGAHYSLSDSEERPLQRGLYFCAGLFLDFSGRMNFIADGLRAARELRAGKD